jgi:hypothetical protein
MGDEQEAKHLQCFFSVPDPIHYVLKKALCMLRWARLTERFLSRKFPVLNLRYVFQHFRVYATFFKLFNFRCGLCCPEQTRLDSNSIMPVCPYLLFSIMFIHDKHPAALCYLHQPVLSLVQGLKLILWNT